MLFIAITSGPRFALVTLWYFLTRRPNSNLPAIVAGTGLLRTLTCGGWTYVTSTDDHNWHDIFMISYLVFTLPWTLGCLALSPPNPKAVQYRKILAGLFFGTLVPLIYFFIQHKVHKVAGGKCLRSSCELMADVKSLHHLCLLRVGPDLVRRRLRRGHCARFRQLRACCQGYKGFHQRVCAIAPEICKCTTKSNTGLVND